MNRIECQNEITKRLRALEERQRVLADAVNEQTAELGEVLRLVTLLHEQDEERAVAVEKRLHYVEQLVGVA
jgi:hypothetical protein